MKAPSIQYFLFAFAAGFIVMGLAYMTCFPSQVTVATAFSASIAFSFLGTFVHEILAENKDSESKKKGNKK